MDKKVYKTLDELIAILKNDNNPKEGRNDLLALLITIKYLVNKTTYHNFINQLVSLIKFY